MTGSAERLSMRKVREVLRLKHELGLSDRAISDTTGIGKSAAAECCPPGRGYRHHPAGSGGRRRRRSGAPAVPGAGQRYGEWGHRLAQGQKKLRRRDVTLLLLWQEYRAGHPDGYCNDRYCDHYCA